MIGTSVGACARDLSCPAPCCFLRERDTHHNQGAVPFGFSTAQLFSSLWDVTCSNTPEKFQLLSVHETQELD
jgi:hypothetical protein